ncbi:hypothetical protein D9M69_599580 [compost metagenome]
MVTGDLLHTDDAFSRSHVRQGLAGHHITDSIIARHIGLVIGVCQDLPFVSGNTCFFQANPFYISLNSGR